jgi:hypothetical protein
MTAAHSTSQSEAGAAVRLRDGLRYAVVVFLTVRVGLSIVAVASVGRIPLPADMVSVGVTVTPGVHNAIDGTDRWDSYWFQQIALHGYAEDADAAFFPAYPFAIRATMLVLPVGSLGAALLVSNACFLGALIVLYALTSREFGVQSARRTVVLMAVFPTSFFFLAPYSESLFLLAVLLSFWWIRSGRWERGAGAGVVAALTRSFGALLVPALLVEAWGVSGDGRKRRMVLACTPMLGLFAYAAYWFVRSGDALRPIHAQGAWMRSTSFFGFTLGWAVLFALRGITQLPHLRGLYRTMDLVLTMLLIIPVIVRWRSMALTYVVYVACVILTTLSYAPPGRPLVSDPRLFLILFPSFWAMSSLLGKRGFVPAVVLSAIGYAVAASLFMNWGLVL